jgi:hypothetical protein
MELPPESLVFEKDVGGVSYCAKSCRASVPVVRMLEPTDDRLNASSMTFPSSELTFLASLWMYFVGLSGFLSFRRDTAARALPRDLDCKAGAGWRQMLDR